MSSQPKEVSLQAADSPTEVPFVSVAPENTLHVEPSTKRNSARRGPDLPPSAEELLSLFRVRLEAFAVCEVGECQALAVPPLEDIVVHYVMSGTGKIQWEGGSIALEQGAIALIPRNFSKRLAGSGIVNTVVDASDGCVLANGMLRFVTPETSGTVLRLACATVSAAAGRGGRLFDTLETPLVACAGGTSAAIFEEVLRELADPAIGTRSIIEASLKQILILVLRRVLNDADIRSPLWVGLLDEPLAAVIGEIVSNPSGCHSLSKLGQLAGMTPICLTQKFQSVLGQSPNEYVVAVRMDAAKKLLLATQLPVKSIAGSVGYASRSHFSREFTKLIGQDPTSFRHSARPS